MFRPLPKNANYEQHFIDPQFQRDPCWDEDLYVQEKFELQQNYNRSPEQIEDDDKITDSHVADKLRCALLNLWRIHRQSHIHHRCPVSYRGRLDRKALKYKASLLISPWPLSVFRFIISTHIVQQQNKHLHHCSHTHLLDPSQTSIAAIIEYLHLLGE